MKLKAIQMLALTLGVVAAWKVRKTLREGEAVPAALKTADGTTGDDQDADPPRNRMPCVGDMPP